MEMNQAVQRRQFLMKAGLVSTGTLAVGTLQTLSNPIQANGQTAQPPTWPFPFVDLDPELAAVTGYDAYYQGACCYGTVQGILSQWKELMGEPFTFIPADMFKYGEGGITGWGSTCGTINGASAMINLVCDMDSARKLINELVAWYSSTAVPFFIPAGKEAIVQNTANSPLCHVSVSKWCKAANATVSSPERKERCARLVADVAQKTCSLLNDHFHNQFVSQNGVSPVTTECMACHGSTGMNTALGKMECTPCHTPDTHPAPIPNWGNY